MPDKRIAIGLDAGLVFTGEFEGGFPKFIGDRRAWDIYDKRLEELGIFYG